MEALSALYSSSCMQASEQSKGHGGAVIHCSMCTNGLFALLCRNMVPKCCHK
jgi:hypothetical protein